MESKRTVVDVIVVTDGKNPSFRAYMDYDYTVDLQLNGGLSCSETVNLHETNDRPVPESVKNGTSSIIDVLVRLEPYVEHSIN